VKGANRNFTYVQRRVGPSNDDSGVTRVTVDAPMLQVDPTKIALPFGVPTNYKGRMGSIPPSQS
jgi:hypothetical protein